MQNPKESHLKVFNMVICYIKGTYWCDIKYFNRNLNQLVGYAKFDWAGDGDD
jgi:hypothetical protein